MQQEGGATVIIVALSNIHSSPERIDLQRFTELPRLRFVATCPRTWDETNVPKLADQRRQRGVFLGFRPECTPLIDAAAFDGGVRGLHSD